jgi:hypothetical protein
VEKVRQPFRGRDAPQHEGKPDRLSLSVQKFPVALPLPPGIWKQGRHDTTLMMGNPGLLLERPYIAALLSQVGGHGEQSAAADRILIGWNAPAVAWQTSDLALDL